MIDYFTRCRKIFRSARLSRSAATAIEFALVAPVFFAIVFGTLEIALVGWYSSLLNDGANQASRYLRDQAVACFRQGDRTSNCTGATIQDVRHAACKIMSAGGMACTAAKMKLAIYSADNPVANPIPSSTIIDNNSVDLTKSRAYVIALGYEWPYTLPTTKMLLRNLNGRTQLQSRVYASTAERVLR